MKKYFVLILGLFCLSIACKTQKKITNNQIQQEQGIEGYVQEYKGNFMPMLNHHKQQKSLSAQPKPLATTVYVYEATNLKNVVQINHSAFYSAIKTKLVTTVQSDTTGYFKVNLPAGKYSLFIKQNGNFYANSFDEKNNIALTVVSKNVFTKVVVKADANAVY